MVFLEQRAKVHNSHEAFMYFVHPNWALPFQTARRIGDFLSKVIIAWQNFMYKIQLLIHFPEILVWAVSTSSILDFDNSRRKKGQTKENDKTWDSNKSVRHC